MKKLITILLFVFGFYSASAQYSYYRANNFGDAINWHSSEIRPCDMNSGNYQDQSGNQPQDLPGGMPPSTSIDNALSLSVTGSGLKDVDTDTGGIELDSFVYSYGSTATSWSSLTLNVNKKCTVDQNDDSTPACAFYYSTNSTTWTLISTQPSTDSSANIVSITLPISTTLSNLVVVGCGSITKTDNEYNDTTDSVSATIYDVWTTGITSTGGGGNKVIWWTSINKDLTKKGRNHVVSTCELYNGFGDSPYWCLPAYYERAGKSPRQEGNRELLNLC